VYLQKNKDMVDVTNKIYPPLSTHGGLDIPKDFTGSECQNKVYANMNLFLCSLAPRPFCSAAASHNVLPRI
jgi:hypothetical protein